MDSPVLESLVVDGACNTWSETWTYRIMETWSKKIIYEAPVRMNGTNNVAEFIALVHGLQLSATNYNNIPVYTDSQTAFSWVAKRVIRSKCNHKCLHQAMKWLVDQDPEDLPEVYKWITKIYGENYADFGNKKSIKR